ncbi:DNA oxidative demethylase AlkB [Martelella alba]|uniref:DNA oxidative demethylase AlkB n=1 Tax=Martelella alba TaxID=2590451 RepID=A0ABY2SHP0_9HYPH|nr:DNA oxidative demethylase AlkB [Martelella alba]TKI04863.1 DNA oxidative demethylase AlkB [Martelella alba]
MNSDLFDFPGRSLRRHESIGPASVILRGYVLPDGAAILRQIASIAVQAPFRRMTTPGGFTMSVAMTSCGACGWITDRLGYRYSRTDPVSGRHWPAMPDLFNQVGVNAARDAGFAGFSPDSCLINRYQPGAKMSLHQDRDERDLSQPIVSVSLGLDAVFLFGGMTRGDKSQRIILRHGDVVVWGGEDRLRFHGVLPLKAGTHPAAGGYRYNLTFRRS